MCCSRVGCSCVTSLNVASAQDEGGVRVIVKMTEDDADDAGLADSQLPPPLPGCRARWFEFRVIDTGIGEFAAHAVLVAVMHVHLLALLCLSCRHLCFGSAQPLPGTACL